MIDNSELCKKLITFIHDDNKFCHCQIVQRAKDHPEKKVGEHAIKTYFVRSAEHLEQLMPEIKLICDFYKARAYINLSPKSFEKMQKELLIRYANNVSKNIIQNPRRVLNSVAGEIQGDPKIWLVDIDDMSLLEDIKDAIIKIYEGMYRKYNASEGTSQSFFPEANFLAEVPTVQGCHLLCYPFNLMAFHQEFPDVMVHKNSMGTLLYMPDLNNNKKERNE